MGDIEEVGPWKCYYQNPFGDYVNHPQMKHTDISRSPSPLVPPTHQRSIYHHYHCNYHSPSQSDSFTSPITSSHQSHPILQYSPIHSPHHSLQKVSEITRKKNTLLPTCVPSSMKHRNPVQSPPLRMMEYIPSDIEQLAYPSQNRSYPTQNQSTPILTYGSYIIKKPGHL